MKYRKKPVVIEAMQWTGDGLPFDEWAPDGPFAIRGTATHSGALPAILSLVITTLEGEMEAKPGDWVIRGIKGEYYPCKPDIFAATYEPVEEA